MYGDQGWYAYGPSKYSHGVNEVAYWSMNADDSKQLPDGGWQAFLAGRQPGYPAAALSSDLETLRAHMAATKKDTTTPDTRLADDPSLSAPR